MHLWIKHWTLSGTHESEWSLTIFILVRYFLCTPEDDFLQCPRAPQQLKRYGKVCASTAYCTALGFGKAHAYVFLFLVTSTSCLKGQLLKLGSQLGCLPTYTGQQPVEPLVPPVPRLLMLWRHLLEGLQWFPCRQRLTLWNGMTLWTKASPLEVKLFVADDQFFSTV